MGLITGMEIDYDSMIRLRSCLSTFSKLEPELMEDNCPMVFDSWNCWNESKPGTVQELPCPNFPHLGFSPSRKLGHTYRTGVVRKYASTI